MHVDEDTTLADSVRWLVERHFSLSDIAWCEDHHMAALREDCHLREGSLVLAQRVTDDELWDDVVDSPSDATVGVDYDDGTDPRVDIEAIATGERLDYTPLCCVLSEDERQAVYDVI